jgi:hypothetical protein
MSFPCFSIVSSEWNVVLKPLEAERIRCRIRRKKPSSIGNHQLETEKRRKAFPASHPRTRL